MNPLTKYRKAYGITQSRLAEKIHVSQGRICDFERGLLKPWPVEANALSTFFGVKVEALFPDGFREAKPQSHRGDWTADAPPAEAPMPDQEPVRPVRQYPAKFRVMCWHCRETIAMRADDSHLPTDADPKCPACGAVFYDILPLQEAANV